MFKALKEDGVEELHSGSNVKWLVVSYKRSHLYQFQRHQLRSNLHKVKFFSLELEAWLEMEANCMQFNTTDGTGVERKIRDQKPATNSSKP